MHAPQQGFTLIELVVVIVIIGILAAFAIPRFSNIATDARTSSVNGLLGSIRSTSALVHGLALARSTANGGTISLEGNNVVIQNGYPDGTATGVVLALSTTSGYNLVYPTATSVRFEVPGGSDQTQCSVTYVQAAANTTPSITAATSGC